MPLCIRTLGSTAWNEKLLNLSRGGGPFRQSHNDIINTIYYNSKPSTLSFSSTAAAWMRVSRQKYMMRIYVGKWRRQWDIFLYYSLYADPMTYYKIYAADGLIFRNVKKKKKTNCNKGGSWNSTPASARSYNSLYTLDMIDSSHFFIKKFFFSFILILFFSPGLRLFHYSRSAYNIAERYSKYTITKPYDL